MTYFNPLDKFYKSQIGAVCAKKEITFRVKGNFGSVVFLLKKDGSEFDECFPMVNKGDFFELSITFDVGLYYYCFLIDSGEFLGLGKDYSCVKSNFPSRYQLTAHSEDYQVPEWFSGGIIYQIFPDRFYASNKNKEIEDGKILHDNWADCPVYLPNKFGKVVNNDFFGGDLQGITEKLDYLSSLGVTTIYLNPIFKSFSNHRYDTGNYMEIDPLLGTIEDFKNLIAKANLLGIKIILDGVFNHTGDDSLYFNKYGNYDSIGAYQSVDSKYYSWFNFEQFPNKYETWWGIETLPSVNESNADFIDYITGKNGVLTHYTKMGIGGWRLDVVDELPGDFVKKIRSAVKDVNQNAVIIGEVWEDASNKISYGKRREYFQGEELDSVMNYPLKNAIIEFVRGGNAKALSNVIKEQLDHYPHFVLHSLMNLLATHDTYRLLTAVAGEDATGKTKSQMENMFISDKNKAQALFRLKAATLLQFTLCGVPSIYYGDEVGMQGYVDPLNRRCYPWGKEDEEILLWYKKLGKIRRAYSAFKFGELEERLASNGTYIFIRKDEDSEVLIAVNVGDNQVVLDFEGELNDLISETVYNRRFVLMPQSLAVLAKIL